MLKVVVPDHMSKYFLEGENMLVWGPYNKLENCCSINRGY